MIACLRQHPHYCVCDNQARESGAKYDPRHPDGHHRLLLSDPWDHAVATLLHAYSVKQAATWHRAKLNGKVFPDSLVCSCVVSVCVCVCVCVCVRELCVGLCVGLWMCGCVWLCEGGIDVCLPHPSSGQARDGNYVLARAGKLELDFVLSHAHAPSKPLPVVHYVLDLAKSVGASMVHVHSFL